MRLVRAHEAAAPALSAGTMPGVQRCPSNRLRVRGAGMRTATITIGLFGAGLDHNGCAGPDVVISAQAPRRGTTSPGTSVGRGAPALGVDTERPGDAEPVQHRHFPPVTPAAADAGLDRHADAGGRQHAGQSGGRYRDHHHEHAGHPRRSVHGRHAGINHSEWGVVAQAGWLDNGDHQRWPARYGRRAHDRTSKRPIPPNSQTSSGGGGTATRTGKNSSNETVADCMKLWEPTTHMSKADWSRTCRRVQGRLDQVTKQVMTK